MEILATLERTGQWSGEVHNVRKDGTAFWCYAKVSVFNSHRFGKVLVSVHADVTDRKRAEEERDKLNGELKEALANIRTLTGIVPICAGCKQIRDEQGHWQEVEVYVRDHTHADFSHGLCPECYTKMMDKYRRTGDEGESH